MKTLSRVQVFLLLSFISGFVELGIIFLGIHNNFSILGIVGLGLAYQIGNLVPNPFNINQKMTIGLSICSVALFICYMLTENNYIVLFIAVALFAMIIQKLRSIEKSNVSTTTKRMFRVAGFLLSIYINYYILIASAILVLTIAILSKGEANNKLILFSMPKVNKLSFIMITHQIHYFSYSYFLLILLNQAYSGYSRIYISLAFVMGWLSYVSISHFLKGQNYLKYFICGHLFLTVSLILLCVTYNNPILILPWILTGFGGGTVYCIEKINKRTEELKKQDITFSENIGHIMGVAAGMAAYLITNSIVVPVILSCITAFITMSLMTIYGLHLRKISARSHI